MNPSEVPVQGGPYISAAFLCEKVLREGDGVLSFIRNVDRFIRPKPTAQIPPHPIQVMLVVALKAGGWTTGNYRVKIRLFKPDAHSPSVEIENQVFFEGAPDHGASIVTPILMAAEEEGLHWIDVLFEDNPITRVPFRVIFATVPSPPQSR